MHPTGLKTTKIADLKLLAKNENIFCVNNSPEHFTALVERIEDLELDLRQTRRDLENTDVAFIEYKKQFATDALEQDISDLTTDKGGEKGWVK